ncbi:MAG: hypothetical protein IJN66_06305 [Muribaculaceae bacterium]|nr:hypothetical protein [Muribaculaceae bacterium]
MDAKQLGILFKKAKEFAQSQGLNYISYRKIWNGFAVYFVSETEPKGVSYGGYPDYILVATDTNARMATFEEINEILAS